MTARGGLPESGGPSEPPPSEFFDLEPSQKLDPMYDTWPPPMEGETWSEATSPRDTTASWAAAAKSQVNAARAIRQEAASHLSKSFDLNAVGGAISTGGMQDALKKRVQQSETHIKNLLTRIEAVENMIQQVSQRNMTLQREYEARWPALSVAERRLDLRTRRPPAENLMDQFQEALEGEHRVLADARKQLAEHIDAGQEVLSSLEGAKVLMVKDVQAKRQLLRLERSSSLFDAFHGKDRACALPPVGGNGSQGRETPNTSAANFVREILARTRSLEQSATTFCSESDALVVRLKRSAEKATQATSVKMKRRINEVYELKQQLQKELAESNQAIAKTDLSLQHMQKSVDAQKFSLSQMDPDREVPLSKFDQRLPYPMLLSMQEAERYRNKEQYEKVKANISMISERIHTAQGLLQQLLDAHRVLQENLDAKTAAWNIDMNCSKVTPAKDETLSGSMSRQASTASSRLGMHSHRRRRPVLAPDLVDTLRARIKSAAYTGQDGRDLALIFGRFDKNGSGVLEDNEVRQALRRTMRIAPSVISDEQILALCAMLDRDGTGVVSVGDLVHFVEGEADDLVSKRTGKSFLGLTLQPIPLPAVEEGANAHSQSQSLSVRSAATPRKRGPPLKPQVIENLRSRIKAASYAGHLGRELEALFARFDRDGSGQLEDDEVRQALRRTLRIPPSVITDAEITSLCQLLDADNSGAISIEEIVDFVGKEPDVSRRTGKAVRNDRLAPSPRDHGVASSSHSDLGHS